MAHSKLAWQSSWTTTDFSFSLNFQWQVQQQDGGGASRRLRLCVGEASQELSLLSRSAKVVLLFFQDPPHQWAFNEAEAFFFEWIESGSYFLQQEAKGLIVSGVKKGRLRDNGPIGVNGGRWGVWGR